MRQFSDSPASFWSEFVRDVWNRRPFATERAPIPAIIGEAELFATVVKAAEVEQAGSVGIDLRLYLDGKQVENLGPAHLPRSEDGSFRGYRDRVLRESGAREFCMMMNAPERVDVSLWKNIRGVCAELFGRAGMNNLGVQCTLFIGEYARTPFGFHNDNDDVLTFPIVGTKHMRTWPESVLEKHPELPGTFDYQHVLDESEVVRAGPGGILYWPSSHWHIAESDGGLNVSLALGFYSAADVSQLFFTPMGRELMSSFSRLEHPMGRGEFQRLPFQPEQLQKSAETLPPFLEAVSRWLVELHDPRAMKLFWLKLSTGFGMIQGPLPAEIAPLSPSDRLRAEAAFPPVAVQVSPKEIGVGAMSSVYLLPAESGVEALIARLASGQIVSVGELLEQFGGSGAGRLAPERLTGLLTDLVRIHCLERL